jgi:Ni/Co efflux regulator RcnB
MRMPRTPLALLIATALAATAMAGPPEGKGKPDKGKPTATGAPAQTGQGRNGGGSGGSDWDEAGFRLFVGQQSYGHYDALPPGIRKNLARGKPLPPGLQSRAVPPEMLRRLPVREGYEWRAIGTDLVLYSITSGLIDQVLNDVFD